MLQINVSGRVHCNNPLSDRVGWVPCDLHRKRKKLPEKDFFPSNEASLEILPVATEQHDEWSVGIRSDNVRDDWRWKEKKRRAQLIICCCFSLTYSFFSSPQKELKWCNLFFFLVRKLLLSGALRPSVLPWKPTACRTPRGVRHKPSYLHAHLHTSIHPEADEQTLCRYIHGSTTQLCIQY